MSGDEPSPNLPDRMDDFTPQTGEGNYTTSPQALAVLRDEGVRAWWAWCTHAVASAPSGVGLAAAAAPDWANSFKTRYVRTPAGAKRYGVPIGSPIPVGRKVKPSTRTDKPASEDGKSAPQEKKAKTRVVRTEAGAKRYGVPIGSPVPLGKRVNKPTAPAAPAPSVEVDEPTRVPLTPAERDVAERRFDPAGTDGDTERGAVVTDDGDLEVVDPDRASDTLDEAAADPDVSAEEREVAADLRDKVTEEASEDESDAGPVPEPDVEPEPELEAPVEDAEQVYQDLLSDWRRNAPKLNNDQRIALDSYAGVGYEDINDFLRGNLELPEDDEEYDIADSVRDQVSVLKGLAAAYELPKTVSLYRRAVEAGAPPYPATPGSVFVDRGFSSTTTVPGGPPGFTNDLRYPNVLQITAPKGTNAINANGTGYGLPLEREIILPPGTRFRVDSDEMRDGTRWLRVTAMPPE